MAIGIIYQGEDKEIEVYVKDKAGDPYDLTGIRGVLLYFYNKSGQIWMRYSLHAYEDYKPIQIIDLSVGHLRVKVNSSETLESDLGTVLGEIKLNWYNSGFDDNDFETVARDASVCEVRRSLTNTKTGYSQ